MARMLPQTTCYAGGDFRLRPFGKIIMVTRHPASTSLPPYSLVCPDSVNDKCRCRQCPNDGGFRAVVMSCWDYRSKRFAQCVLHIESFEKAKKKYSKFNDASEFGDGPDLIMQWVGSTLEFEVGLSGGRPWGSRPLPDYEGSVSAMASKSIWLKYDRPQVEAYWPKES